MVFSVEDDAAQPSEELIALALEAIQRARSISLADLDERLQATRLRLGMRSTWRVDQWPGEHYRLLSGLTLAVRPRGIIEFGTGSGLSALAMKKFLPAGSELHTFDLSEWSEVRPFTCLTAQDFEDGQLVFHREDLSDPSAFAANRGVVEDADLWFLDGPKDGITEARLLDHLAKLPRRSHPRIMLFDDTRVWNMLALWRHISAPKLDVTSFGHWLGSGVVEWP